MDMQKLINTMNEHGRTTRAGYHLTLGQAIDKLKAANAESVVLFDFGGSPNEAMSYRGYYSDLAFDKKADPITVVEFLEMCREALGKTFTGYKGGDFTMSEDTPLWASEYGTTGYAIIGLKQTDKAVVLVTKELD